MAATSSAQVWWALVQKRFEEVRLGLAKDLAGALEFEILGSDVAFHLVLDGPRSRAGEGRAEAPRARIFVDEAALSCMLSGGLVDRPVFRVAGDFALYHDFFHALAHASQPKSWLEIRARR